MPDDDETRNEAAEGEDDPFGDLDEAEDDTAPPADGELDHELPGMPPKAEIWPPFQGRHVDAVKVTLSGGDDLGYSEDSVALARAVWRERSVVNLNVTAYVDKVSHHTETKKGAYSRHVGTSTLKVTGLSLLAGEAEVAQVTDLLYDTIDDVRTLMNDYGAGAKTKPQITEAFTTVLEGVHDRLAELASRLSDPAGFEPLASDRLADFLVFEGLNVAGRRADQADAWDEEDDDGEDEPESDTGTTSDLAASLAIAGVDDEDDLPFD